MVHEKLFFETQKISEKIIHGFHHSQFYGQGVEFMQYKNFEHGDDPRFIDWKRYVKTGKKLLKQAGSEKRLSIHIMVDTSLSMNYVELGHKRRDIAQRLASVLVSIALRQHDECHLYAWESSNCAYLTKVNSLAHVVHVLENLELGVKPNVDISRLPISNSILILIGDFLGLEESDLENLSKIGNSKNDIYYFQILGNEEINSPDLSGRDFKDFESSKTINSETKSSIYKEKFQYYHQFLKERLQAESSSFSRIVMGQDLAIKIQEALSQRSWNF